MTPPLPVVVWSDIGCPWAALALHILRATAARRASPLRVDHRAFPLELFNRQPTPKFIVDAEVVAIAGLLPELGWRRWTAPEWTYPVTTLPAMEAVQAAKSPEVGGLVASDELDAALRHAFYAESRCVSMRSTILDIAADCPNLDSAALARALESGAGRAEVQEQWERAQAADIQGSPHLFAEGGYASHNPGVTYQWTDSPLAGGFPRLTSYTTDWADDLLDELEKPADPAAERYSVS